jgi:hypothetical protein
MIHLTFVSVCVSVLKAFDPPLKRVFCQDYNGAFRFNGGGGGCSLRSTIRNNKNRKNFKLGRDEKLTRLLPTHDKVGRR